jgi:hypothetical protein
MAPKLTETWLREQELADSSDKTFWDSEITGFGIRVFAPTKRRESGGKSFFVNDRVDALVRVTAVRMKGLAPRRRRSDDFRKNRHKARDATAADHVGFDDHAPGGRRRPR